MDRPDASRGTSAPSILSRLRNKLLMGIALGALVFVGFSVYSGYHDLAAALAEVSWLTLPVIFALAFLNYILRFFKWDYYLRRLRIDLSRAESLIVFFSGLIMVITPGKLGELLKAYLVRKLNGTPISQSAPIIVAERLTDFIALIILSMVGIGFYSFRDEKYVLMGTAFLILLFVGLVTWRGFSLKIIDLVQRVRPLERTGRRLRVAYESIYALMTPRCLFWATALSVAAWFCECLGLWVTLRFFLDDPNLLVATFVYAVATIVGVVSPGGIGPTEIVMTGFLQRLMDASRAKATAATFIIRIATLWFAVLVGALVLAIHQRRFEGVTEMLDQDRV